MIDARLLAMNNGIPVKSVSDCASVGRLRLPYKHQCNTMKAFVHLLRLTEKRYDA